MFWTVEGWADSGRDADHVTVRKLVCHNFGRIKAFWQAHGIWLETGSHDEGVDLQYEGPTLSDLPTAACAACGANVWITDRGPFVAEYDTGEVCGYCSYDWYFEHRTQNRLEEIVDERSVFIPP